MKWKTSDIAGGAAINAMGTLLSRIMGFIRDMLIARYLGTLSGADAFFAAFQLPNLFRQLLGEGAFSAAFIPSFLKIRQNQGEEEGKKFASSAAWVLFMALLLVSIMGMLGATELVKLMVGGFARTPGKLELTIEMTRILFPYLIFVGLAAHIMAILNSCGHFWTSSVAPVLFNLSAIFAMIGGGLMGINQGGMLKILAYSALFGGFLQLIFQLPQLYKRGYRLNFPSLHPGIKEMLILMGPAVFGIAITQLNILVDKRFASSLPDGGVSYLYYANRLMQFPLGIFGVAISTASIPAMATHIAGGDWPSFRHAYSFALRLSAFIILPCSAVLMAFGDSIIDLLFQRGQFDISSTMGTSGALYFYSIGLLFYTTSKITAPIFYSLGRPGLPVKAGIISMLANILFNTILIGPMGHKGLALGTALSGLINALMLVFWLYKESGGLYLWDMAKGIVASFFISLITVWAGIFLMNYLHVIITILIIGVLYFALSLILGIKEGQRLWGIFLQKLGKSGKIALGDN